MIIHRGCNSPALHDCIVRNDRDWLFMHWGGVLGGEVITYSQWFLPDGFNLITSVSNVNLQGGDSLINNCCGLLFEVTAPAGEYEIVNTVRISDHRVLHRGARLRVVEF